METETLSTAEAILIDGANGVTHASRDHFPFALGSLGLAVIVVLMVALRAKRGPRWLVPVVLAAAATPGLVQVLVLRADAPVPRVALADTIARTLADLQQRAPWPATPVRLVREDDDVLFPLTRYAVPARPVIAGPAVELETRGTRLGEPCRVDGARVICGAGP